MYEFLAEHAHIEMATISENPKSGVVLVALNCFFGRRHPALIIKHDSSELTDFSESVLIRLTVEEVDRIEECLENLNTQDMRLKMVELISIYHYNLKSRIEIFKQKLSEIK